MMSDTSASPEYKSFRSSIQQKKIVVDKNSSKEWIVYDAGPKDVRCPLICLPPVSGTADVFFKQMLTLSTLGYRTIAVSYPVYWTLEEFYIGFRRLIDHLGLDKVHLFGASLGGYLAQKFAEHVADCMIVHSLVLCNAFCDTSVFNYTDAAAMFWMMPSFVLKRLVMGSFPNREVDPEIADSLDFMVEKLDSLGQQELASRLTLNCLNSFVNPEPISHLDVTLLDVFDECAISLTVKDSMYKLYPNAKMAHMKSGGNFPYLSRSAEVNVHLQVHLRKYIGTKYSACEAPSPSTKPTSLEFLQAAQCSGDSTDTVEALNTIDSRGDRLPSFTDEGASSPKLTASKHIPSDDEEDGNMFGGGSVTDSTKPCVSDDENIFGVSENIDGTKSFVLEDDDEIIFGGSTADSTKPCVSDDENMFGEPVTDNNSKWENFDDRFLVDRDDFQSSKLGFFQEESSAHQSALDNEKSILSEENDIIFGGSELGNSKLVMNRPGKSSKS